MDIKTVDTAKYLESYRENIAEKTIVDAVIDARMMKMILFFPDLLIRKILYKLKEITRWIEDYIG